MTALAATAISAAAIALAGCGPERAGCDDPSNPSVVCEPAIEVACAGPLTGVDLSASGACDGAIAIDNRPSEGFAPGVTVVVFESDDGQTCSTEVTVTDDVPPAIDCPAGIQVVLLGPGDVDISGVEASDNCSDPVALRVEPADLPSGANTVDVIARDIWGNEASCSAQVQVIRALAPTRPAIASAELSGPGITAVTVGWEPSADSADVTGYRISRADTPDGPFADIADVAADTLLFTDTLPGPRASYRITTLAGDIVGGTSDPITAHAIAATSYDIRDRSIPNIGFPTTLYGVVRHPADLTGGPYPLIAMLHGNHGICRDTPDDPDDFCLISDDHECPDLGAVTTPNAEGMIYLAETLASHGFIAVTISGNAMNCRQNFISERGELIVEHLRQWLAWSDPAGDAPFATEFSGAVDLGAVGLLGHSRGAEAVSLVPSLLAENPVAGVELGAVYALAPTDFENPEVIDAPYLLALPGCDGDVFDLQGARIYDRSLGAATPGTKAQVLFIGANHNFFNTNWEQDDGAFSCNAGLVGDLPQRRMLERTAGDWFRAHLGGAALAPDQTADRPRPESLVQAAGLDVDLRWSFAAAGREVIEDFSDGDIDTNELGLANIDAGFTAAGLCVAGQCGNRFIHQVPGIELTWNGGAPLYRLELGGLDAGGRGSLAFRAVSPEAGANNSVETQDFRIRLIDDAGQMSELLLSDTQRIAHLYDGSNAPHEVLQTVRTPLDDFVAINPDLDLSSLAAIEIEMSAPTNTGGAIVITDLELHD
jgi:hypothetical protein